MSIDAAGLYGPDSEAWRLSREAMLLLGGGPRALLLQLAHPLVAAAVDEHSDFRSNPWDRLQATLRSIMTIVYGTTTAARAEIRRLNGLHGTIAGSGYDARDPELSLWVHATLVDTTIAANDAWIEPLQRERRARFYAETLPIGRAFGVPPNLLPPTLEAFEAYVARMLAPGGPIRVSPAARELADAIVHPPLGPIVPALAGLPPRLYTWSFWPSIGLLPPSVRDDYGFRWGALERAVSAWLVAGWRGWRPFFPTWLRQVPQALAADRRVGRSP
jgi:uncharacterized protein (DUF2236 family)